MKQKNNEPQFDKNNIKAIIGLGNPGSRYHRTRHNIGERVVDELGNMLYANWGSTERMASTQVKLSPDPYDMNAPQVYLIKPLTYMNNSGQVIPGLLKKGIKPDQILVVHDELEKKLGKIDIKFGGSARGHNGLRSIINIIGKDFWRLRFGIGRPAEKSDVGDYVLRPFLPEEEAELEQLIPQALDLIIK